MKPYSDARKKRHREYMQKWRQSEKARLWLQNWRKGSVYKKKRKRHYDKFVKTHGATKITVLSRASEATATMTREPWGPVEDALLFSGKTHRELAPLLGRTIRAIGRRKHRLRQEEALLE